MIWDIRHFDDLVIPDMPLKERSILQPDISRWDEWIQCLNFAENPDFVKCIHEHPLPGHVPRLGLEKRNSEDEGSDPYWTTPEDRKSGFWDSTEFPVIPETLLKKPPVLRPNSYQSIVNELLQCLANAVTIKDKNKCHNEHQIPM